MQGADDCDCDCDCISLMSIATTGDPVEVGQPVYFIGASDATPRPSGQTIKYGDRGVVTDVRGLEAERLFRTIEVRVRVRVRVVR